MLLDGNITEKIIGAAIEVHKNIGPGLLEGVYEECLFYELQSRGIEVQRQVELPVIYKGKELSTKYRLDLLVNQQVVIELKASKRLEPIHEAQLLTYLKMAGLKFGLLLNFNVPVMRQGIKRILNGL